MGGNNDTSNDDDTETGYFDSPNAGKASFFSSKPRAHRRTSKPRATRKETPLSSLLFPICDDSEVVTLVIWPDYKTEGNDFTEGVPGTRGEPE